MFQEDAVHFFPFFCCDRGLGVYLSVDDIQSPGVIILCLPVLSLATDQNPAPTSQYCLVRCCTLQRQTPVSIEIFFKVSSLLKSVMTTATSCLVVCLLGILGWR